MRPEAQIFFHVVGAVALFGATGTVAVLGFAGRTREDSLPLARFTLGTLLLLAIPGWVTSLVFGSWAQSAANWSSGVTWIEIGLTVSNTGLLFLVAATALAFGWVRRPSERLLPTAIGILATLYLVGLAVAWWVMTTKLPT